MSRMHKIKTSIDMATRKSAFTLNRNEAEYNVQKIKINGQKIFEK